MHETELKLRCLRFGFSDEKTKSGSFFFEKTGTDQNV